MRLLLHHPAVARLSCDDCERFMVAVPVTGQIIRNKITDEPVRRPASVPTPCQSCAKCGGLPSPQCNSRAGRESELSEKNWRTVELYYRVKGSVERGLVMDAITRHNFGLVEREIRAHESNQREATNHLLARLINTVEAGKEKR